MSNGANNVILVAVIAAAFFPSLIAIVRGARENHLGGILLLNLMHVVATGASSFLGLASIAILPFSGLVFFALCAWAFIAPGRVADRDSQHRHRELLAALTAKK